MFSRLTSSSALTIYVPPAIYTEGSTVAGEVSIDFRQLREENVEEVQLRLRGSSKTSVPSSRLPHRSSLTDRVPARSP